MQTVKKMLPLGFALSLIALMANSNRANAAQPAGYKASAAQKKAVDQGIAYLTEKGQSPDGSFSNKTGTGVTSLCLQAMLRNGRNPNDPAVAKGLKYLEANARDDGGIYAEKSFLKNYETCLAVVCFKEANQGGKYDKLLKNADKYLRGLQIDGGEDKTPADFEYGGVGYGSKGRPDLSNTAFLVEALTAAGAGPDDEAVKRALIFVSRCQNLESEHNTSPFAAKVNDGGFYYSVVGETPADKNDDGGLRSYGSMTYAGFKSMLYAGLKPDDPRVKAASQWIKKHYDVEKNPGLDDAGLYYYYHLMAKALSTLGDDKVVDAAGKSHDWRAELVAQLANKQSADGSWVNKNKRWLETDPNLVTAYALLTLSYCGK